MTAADHTSSLGDGAEFPALPQVLSCPWAPHLLSRPPDIFHATNNNTTPCLLMQAVVLDQVMCEFPVHLQTCVITPE